MVLNEKRVKMREVIGGVSEAGSTPAFIDTMAGKLRYVCDLTFSSQSEAAKGEQLYVFSNRIP